MNKEILRLMAGFRRFHEKYFEKNNAQSVYHKLASSGQTPKTLMIGCSDSRVDPAILTEAEPGELFVIRNVANLVPPCEPSAVGFHGTSSAIEFAVINLKVENIVILGHRQCGGIRALMGGSKGEPTFIEQWMRIAEDARDAVLKAHPKSDQESLCRFAEMESIKVSIRNLQTFSFVQEAVQSGQLQIFGIYFDLEQGQLWEYHEGSTEFRQLQV
jgi:carbonic anhydrase